MKRLACFNLIWVPNNKMNTKYFRIIFLNQLICPSLLQVCFLVLFPSCYISTSFLFTGEDKKYYFVEMQKERIKSYTLANLIICLVTTLVPKAGSMGWIETLNYMLNYNDKKFILKFYQYEN